MSITLDGSNGVTFNDSSLQGAAASPYGLKNRIINGDMRIDQRNAGASVTPTATGTSSVYTLDRWRAFISAASKISIQQNAGSVTPPAGFTNYLGVTSLAATTVGASDYYTLYQCIEGYNVADFAYGTASAKTTTLSFWVRSSLTGTFGAAITNGGSRTYPFTYTISSANTWEQKTVTITGDTTTATGTTNSFGLYVVFGLGVGSSLTGATGSWLSADLLGANGATNVVGTNGATFYITGVQLEIGSTATPFERRMYGQELQLCQRYYWIKRGNDGTGQYQAIASGTCVSTSTPRVFLPYPVSMRAAPTVSYAGSVLVQTNSSAINVTGIPNNFNGTLGSMLEFSLTSGVTAGNGAVAYLGNLSGDYIQATAEL